MEQNRKGRSAMELLEKAIAERDKEYFNFICNHTFKGEDGNYYFRARTGREAEAFKKQLNEISKQLEDLD